jgi:hypothetical protein
MSVNFQWATWHYIPENRTLRPASFHVHYYNRQRSDVPDDFLKLIYERLMPVPHSLILRGFVWDKFLVHLMILCPTVKWHLIAK